MPLDNPLQIEFLTYNDWWCPRTLTRSFNRFKKAHNAYSKVAAIKKVSEPNQKDVAKELKISLATLMEDIKFYNQILPKGYLFFAKKSKLSKKFAEDTLAAW